MHVKRFEHFLNETQQHEELDILALPPSKFVRLIEFLEMDLDTMEQQEVRRYQDLTDIDAAKLLGLYNAYGAAKHEREFTEQFKEQYAERKKTTWDEIVNTKEKKTFSMLGGWKKYVLNQGHRYKLQSANDPYEWIAFSDDDSETKGFFHSYTESNDDHTMGDGWASSN